MSFQYLTIEDAFRACIGRVTQLEILPAGFRVDPDTRTLPACVSNDGDGVAILKDGLLRAVPEASKRLIHCEIGRHARSLTEEQLRATEILLMANPEHITAANWRKRHMLAQRTDHERSGQRKDLEDEMRLLESFLTSPLNRHTKSPNLWAHRRFIVQQLFSVPAQANAPSLNQLRGHGRYLNSVNRWRDFCGAEIGIVAKAGAIHPRNYYAWSYARWVLDMMDQHLGKTDAGKADVHFIMLDCAKSVRSWCQKHPADISGWSFLLYLLDRCDASDSSEAMINELLVRAFDFQWDHESFWNFIRTVVASNRVLSFPKRLAIRKIMQEKLSALQHAQMVAASHGGHREDLRGDEKIPETFYCHKFKYLQLATAWLDEYRQA